MQKEKAPLGLYIHIPFCRQKCAYCDFYSLPRSEEKMDAYTAALLRHIEEVAPRTAAHRVDTVYFGGGTPSYLGPDRLTKLLRTLRKRCPVARDAEITLEANPDSACDVKALRALRRAGFNRISLGVQSADDGLLRAIGRIHTFAQVQEAVAAVRKAGFKNLSMDLIYGLPGQTMQQWEDTLAAVIALAPEHISCYGLKLEPGTPLYDRRDSECFPDDDAQADMYLYAVTVLAQNGYEQYEISNFAKPGFASRHNLKYWHMEEYAGFGPGAHSDFGGRRYSFVRDLDRYIDGVLKGGEIIDSEELIPQRERGGEYLMLRLRTAQGIEEWEYRSAYFMDFAPLETRLRQFQAQGWAEQAGGRWRLTPKGFLVSNQLIGDLLERQEESSLDQLLPRARARFSGSQDGPFVDSV